MKRTTIWLTEAERSGLEALSRKTGTRAAELMRRFIDDGLAASGYLPMFAGSARHPSKEPAAFVRALSAKQLKKEIGRGGKARGKKK